MGAFKQSCVSYRGYQCIGGFSELMLPMSNLYFFIFLIFLNQTQVTFICGPKSDTYLMFYNVTLV